MRTYEALYIVRPDLGDEEIQTIAKEVESLVTADGGAIVRSEIWGKRKLAYDVKKFSDGCYALLRFAGSAACVAKLERYFRLSESVIRSLVVYFDEKTLALEAEQKRRKEEEIRLGSDEMRRRERRAGRRDSDDEEDEITAPVRKGAAAHGGDEDDEGSFEDGD